MKKKPIFIIPGFRHKPSGKAYRAIASMLRREGYAPILVTIPWKQSTISENTALFLKKYNRIEAKEKYILGFSFGAMIGFLAATKVKPAGLILCSLSPYFKEDMKKKPKTKASSITMRRFEDFSTLHCAALARKIKSKRVHFLYGMSEEKAIIQRANHAYTHIPSLEKSVLPI
nr:hypothetical protein [Candidatus Levybacteria bacterium]